MVLCATNDLLNDGVILENMMKQAFNNASVLPYWKMNTARACSMRTIRAMLEGMTEWVKMMKRMTTMHLSTSENERDGAAI